jgi:hypothetical protein
VIRAYRFRPAPFALLPVVFLSLATLATTGCNGSPAPGAAPPATPRTLSIHGLVYGGQQPVTGATIQLYAAGAPTSGGSFGTGATALITGTLPTTDNNGAFSITGKYTLPSTPSYFYIVSTGGSPGLGNRANPDIVLMAAIGGCAATSTLSSSLFININEVTTAATILEFASGLEANPFMAAPTGAAGAAVTIGAPAANYNDLRTVFENISNLADISTGEVSTAGSKGQLINTLADILAYCVNSDPGSDSHCATLFTTATPNGDEVAGDTAQAAWYIAQNPTTHTGALFGLIPPSPPFPALNSAPASFAVTAPTDLVACFAVMGGAGVTSAGATIVSGGDLGTASAAAVTGFTFSTPAGPGVVMAPATVYLNDAIAVNGQSDLANAANYAAGLAKTGSLGADISNSTFTPGVYNAAAAVGFASGTVTLDALGDPDAVFIFQIGSTITTAAGTRVVLINNAQVQNVFWQVGSSATIGGSFAGTIMAYASITFPSPIALAGRALANTGAVTFIDDTVTAP